MSSRIRPKETCRIDISRGDYLVVKKHLTAGETRKVFGLMMRRGATGDEIDPLKVGIARMAVYLVDWSIDDTDIRRFALEENYEAIMSALDDLDPEDFAEILKAIETHDSAMEALRAEEKKTRAGSPKSDQIWPSLEPSAGGMSGSLN